MAMKKYYYCFEPSEFKDLLLAFSDQVDKKNYYKLDYSLWRAMKNYQSFVDVEWFEYSEGDKMKIVLHLNGNECIAVFNDDCSFGEYLYTEWLFDKELAQSDPYGLRYNTFSYDLNSCPDVAVLGATESKWELAIDDNYLTDKLGTKADLDHVHCLESRVDEVNRAMNEIITFASPMKNNNIENKKEKNIMKFNFDFGPVNSNTVRMSLYGLAVKNKAGTYVSYDAKSGSIMDVDVLNFDGAKFLYKMPVAMKDIAIGDVIVHHNVPMFVVATGNGYVTAVDPIAGERKEVMLTKSPFGFDFVTKVVNFLGNLNTGADASNPFGNLGLMLMLNEGGNMNDLLPLMLMTGNSGLDMSNPLMLYALLGDNKGSNDLLPLMLMMNANKPAAPAHECKCGGHCGENHGSN
jgi:hypothetical protein